MIALVLVPIASALVTCFLFGEEKRTIRRWILFATALFHTIGTATLFFKKPVSSSSFITLDSLGLLFLSVTSLLFLLVALYSFGYFHNERRPDAGSGVSHFYVPCMLFFLAAMTLTAMTQHLGLLWVAIEGTTLASAPLIYYSHTEKSLEATWKYLLVCSVGIALALLGLFFFAAAAGGQGTDLDTTSLLSQANRLDVRWLRIGFILILVGFGTKMGLAPMHAWLPDAHSEAPSPVSALLSGALLNCAFLGVLRFYQICMASGLGHFVSRLFIIFGLLSLFISAGFILIQRDYKRMLAYSSIEHMGILILGLGVGANFASLLHVINHSFAKALLFLTAGQILVAYRTKLVSEVHGICKKLPLTGALFVFGSLAILGSPPFAPFVSEFLIFKHGLSGHHVLTMVLYLLALGVVFVGMSRLVFGMVLGEPRDLPEGGHRPSWPMVVAPVLLAIPVLVLGIYLPPPLVQFLTSAVHLLGGTP